MAAAAAQAACWMEVAVHAQGKGTATLAPGISAPSSEQCVDRYPVSRRRRFKVSPPTLRMGCWCRVAGAYRAQRQCKRQRELKLSTLQALLFMACNSPPRRWLQQTRPQQSISVGRKRKAPTSTSVPPRILPPPPHPRLPSRHLQPLPLVAMPRLRLLSLLLLQQSLPCLR